VRQKLLVSKADAGDALSQVEYATQLESGAVGVMKDLQLSRDYFVKAAVQGNQQGLAGVARAVGAGTTSGKEGSFLFILKLVNAKLEKAAAGQDGFYVNSEDLAVDVPAGMTYTEVRVAEVVARTFYSYYASKDLKPKHFSYDGALMLLQPLKRQMEKSPLATARSKVEFVLVSHALSNPGETFGQERLGLVKQAAVALDPVAFGLLGDVSSMGLSGKKNQQAAAIFYGISAQLKRDRLIQSSLAGIDSKYDRKTMEEMVEEFTKTKVAGRANINFIEAMLRIEPRHDVIEK
jgi:TPR repeat protein